MIWFSCKCGKVHGRPDNSAGTLVFCTCGQGLTVPWESTAPEPEPTVPVITSAIPQPPPLRLDPVLFDPVSSRGGPAPGTTPRTGPAMPPLDRPESSRRRRTRLGPRDPNFCFNHEELPRQTNCADCGESFCINCLVTFQGRSLCGPCKNFRARVLERPLPVSRFAQASATLAILSALFMTLLAYVAKSWLIGVVAFVPPIAALILGILALREFEQEERIGGRSLAYTGVIGGAVAALIVIVLTIFPGGPA